MNMVDAAVAAPPHCRRRLSHDGPDIDIAVGINSRDPSGQIGLHSAGTKWSDVRATLHESLSTDGPCAVSHSPLSTNGADVWGGFPERFMVAMDTDDEMSTAMPHGSPAAHSQPSTSQNAVLQQHFFSKHAVGGDSSLQNVQSASQPLKWYTHTSAGSAVATQNQQPAQSQQGQTQTAVWDTQHLQSCAVESQQQRAGTNTMQIETAQLEAMVVRLQQKLNTKGHAASDELLRVEAAVLLGRQGSLIQEICDKICRQVNRAREDSESSEEPDSWQSDDVSMTTMEYEGTSTVEHNDSSSASDLFDIASLTSEEGALGVCSASDLFDLASLTSEESTLDGRIDKSLLEFDNASLPNKERPSEGHTDQSLSDEMFFM